MTAQTPENLIHDGAEHALCSTPLDQYFEITGTQPEFACPRTGLWRGYVGTWEIAGARLYLVGLRGHYPDGWKDSLASLFPESSGRVFADWYSGTLRVPQGEMLAYVHGGFASTFERDLFIDIERGEVRKTYTQENDPRQVVDDDF